MRENERLKNEETAAMQNNSNGQPHSKIQLFITTGLLTALVFVVTRFLGIPMPGDGWLNLGDSSIAASALLMPHPLMGFVGGVGSALSNITSPALIYAPGTLIIKGAMGYVLYLFAKKGKFTWFALGVFLAEVIMFVGYTVYTFTLYSFALLDLEAGVYTALAGTLLTVPGNLTQAGANFALALLLFAPIMAVRKALWGSGPKGSNESSEKQG